MICTSMDTTHLPTCIFEAIHPLPTGLLNYNFSKLSMEGHHIFKTRLRQKVDINFFFKSVKF